MLNLDYEPEKVVCTKDMPEEEWLNWRRQGLGGSDVSVVMGCSPYRTMRELYYDKAGLANALPDDHNWLAKEVGHRLEGLVAEVFAKETGYRVWQEEYIFRHPLHPLMLANVDRLIQLPDGKKGILEIKTSHYQNKDKWANDMIPRHYELQGRFYMAVMNLDFCYFACLFSNSANDFVIRRIERDLDSEELMIMELEYFWNTYVLAGQEPPLVEDGEMVLDTLKRHYGIVNSSPEEVELSEEMRENIELYLRLKEKKASFDRCSRELEAQIKSVYAPIVDKMGGNFRAVLNTQDMTYHISYTPASRLVINKEQTEKLKLKYPDIFEELAIPQTSQPFKVTATPKPVEIAAQTA